MYYFSNQRLTQINELGDIKGKFVYGFELTDCGPCVPYKKNDDALYKQHRLKESERLQGRSCVRYEERYAFPTEARHDYAYWTPPRLAGPIVLCNFLDNKSVQCLSANKCRLVDHMITLKIGLQAIAA